MPRRHRGELEVLLYQYSTSALEGWSLPYPGCFSPEKNAQYLLYRRLGWPWSWSGWVRKVSPLRCLNPSCRDINWSPSTSSCGLLPSQAFCLSLLDFSNSYVYCLPRGIMKDTMCVLVGKRPVGNFTCIKTVMYGLMFVCLFVCLYFALCYTDLCIRSLLWSEEWHNYRLVGV